jgi:hypothetical protein
MKLPTLFEISNEYKLALAELVDLEDDAVVDTLDALKGTLEVKAGNVSAFIRTLESTSSAMKRAEGQIAQRRLVLDRKIDRITKYIKTNMLNAGIKKIELPEFVISVKDNPPKVDIVNEDILPEKYFRSKTTIAPDKTAIKKDMVNGKDVDGCSLIKNTRLEIK